MKKTYFVLAIVPPAMESGKTFDMNGSVWYILGVLIALCLLGYLIYSLVKPEKF
jgi:K+-transporting ATPase KdpF subunit